MISRVVSRLIHNSHSLIIVLFELQVFCAYLFRGCVPLISYQFNSLTDNIFDDKCSKVVHEEIDINYFVS